MAGKTHPYLQVTYITTLVFGALIFFILFLALYVHGVVTAVPDLPAQTVEKNITAPGKVYPRQ